MDNQTVEEVKRMWETWDIRVFILGSLSIQALLTFLAPFRKTSASAFLRSLIWVLYLSADAIGVFVIGLISSNEADSPHKKEILAFWAPFVLLHLGGPDTITAIALEDNELWHRHALQLVTQVAITIYVLVLSFQHKGLVAPTMLMFVDGFWKYFERTCALFSASSDTLRDSLLGKLERKKSEDSSSLGNQNQSTDDDGLIPNSEEVESDEKMVIKAHQFYSMIRPILADGLLSPEDRKASQSFFLRNKNAFKIIEIELNLIYDHFYTKISLFQKKRRTLARLVCFIVVIVSLIIFCLKDRSKYDKVDVLVTFVLLGGAIILDIIAAVMFVNSDWGIIMSLDGNFKHYYKSLLLLILKYLKWARQPGCRRWSESISKYNLLKRFFRNPPFFFSYFSSIKRTRDFIIGWFYVEIQESNEKLIEFVIKELKRMAEEVTSAGGSEFVTKERKEKATRANEVEVAKEVCSARGNEFVTKELKEKATPANEVEVAKEGCSAIGNQVLQEYCPLASEYLIRWTLRVDYDESILIWHLATDFCYWGSDEIEIEENSKQYREISKALSDYMSYILLKQQTMQSSLGAMSETRFKEIYDEATTKFMKNNTLKFSWFTDPWWKAKRFLGKILHCQCRITSSQDRGTSQDQAPSEREEISFYKECSRKVLKSDVQPTFESKSVLSAACDLAKQLETFEGQKWEVTSKVWVELLCSAAVRCSPRSHIAQLSKGGELITLVWLYMAHTGLGEDFLRHHVRLWGGLSF